MSSDRKTTHTPGPWRVSERGEPIPAPDDLPADRQKQWNDLQAEMCKPFRHNDGSFVIVKDTGDERGPVATATFQGKAKRGQAWNTDDPEGLANARLIAAAPDLLAALEAVSRLDYLNEHNALAEQVRQAIARVRS